LEIVRRVGDEEVEKTQNANVLVQRLANPDSYGRLVELYSELEQALGMTLPPVRHVSQLNRIARALGKVTVDHVGDLRRWANAVNLARVRL
jgi:hypothetical protein